MKKIPTVFVRDPDNRARVLDEVTPGCEWVLAGEGVPTRKWDGTCCKVEGGVLWKRREVKKGKTPPEGFVEEDFDETTGKRQGWVLVGDGPEDAIHREAFGPGISDGTYELVGPKVNGNPDRWPRHALLRHGADASFDRESWGTARTFDDIRNALADHAIEGIVWHHPDGRMAKIKRRDFGLAWPPSRSGGADTTEEGQPEGTVPT